MKKAVVLLITILFSVSLFAQMTMVFNTNLSEGKKITLLLYGTVDVNVNWGDGFNSTYIGQGSFYHTYATEGTYTVKITGDLSHYGTDNAPNSADKLIKVTDFGDLGLTDLSYAFMDCVNLIEVPTSIPATVTNLSHMFLGATAFNHDIGAWDVSNVTNMHNMFSNASSFNQDIGAWDVSNVTDIRFMFCYASIFNQNIGMWNVGNVIDMAGMFAFASTFDQDISNWDVSNVTNMTQMFVAGTLSVNNYDALLNSWSEQTVQENVNFYVGYSQYSSQAEVARTRLINEASWVITDWGKIEYTDLIENDISSEGLNVFPNPTTGQFQIEAKDITNIEILSATGHLIKSIDPQKKAKIIDLSQEVKGVYFVKVKTSKGTKTKKLILE